MPACMPTVTARANHPSQGRIPAVTRAAGGVLTGVAVAMANLLLGAIRTRTVGMGDAARYRAGLGTGANQVSEPWAWQRPSGKGESNLTRVGRGRLTPAQSG